MPRARPAPAPGLPVCATRDGTRQKGNAFSARRAPGARTGSGRRATRTPRRWPRAPRGGQTASARRGST
eukprot:1760201-Rhodomonas_salina.1